MIELTKSTTLEDVARDLILDHAKDVERLTIHEQYGEDLVDADVDEVELLIR